MQDQRQKKFKRSFGLLLPQVFACILGTGAHAEDRVIYGEDGRVEITDSSVKELYRQAAQATAVVVSKRSLRAKSASEYFLPDMTFGESHQLCKDEPFAEQPNPGFCSAFLIAEDIMVTAGHCVSNQAECDEMAFVFDFNYESDNSDILAVSSERTFSCKSIIARDLNPLNQNDYAIVKLDRKVEGREPLQLRQEGDIAEGTEVAVIGNPRGLPTKLTEGAIVRDSSNPIFFKTNLDSYQGNSGSAVINKDGIVEGILVRGEEDFELRGSCFVSKRCANNECQGEDVTRTSAFIGLVPNAEEEARPRKELATLSFEQTLDIPDGDPQGIVIPLETTEEGVIAELTVTMDIEHTYTTDLEVALVHPDGSFAILMQQPPQGALKSTWTFGHHGDSAPDLRKFKGKPTSGTWKVLVRDISFEDQGKISNILLDIRAYAD